MKLPTKSKPIPVISKMNKSEFLDWVSSSDNFEYSREGNIYRVKSLQLGSGSYPIVFAEINFISEFQWVLTYNTYWMVNCALLMSVLIALFGYPLTKFIGQYIHLVDHLEWILPIVGVGQVLFGWLGYGYFKGQLEQFLRRKLELIDQR